jgi:hypothetical protein
MLDLAAVVAELEFLRNRIYRLETENSHLKSQVSNLNGHLTALTPKTQSTSSRRKMLKQMFVAISAATVATVALNNNQAQAGFDNGLSSTGNAAVFGGNSGIVGVIITATEGSSVVKPTNTNVNTKVGLLAIDANDNPAPDVRDIQTAIYGVGTTTYGAILKGAIAPLRLVPAGSGTGSPGGTHQTGEFYVDSGGALYYCSNGGANNWQQLNTTASGVTSLNNLTDAVTIAATGRNTLSVAGNTLTINGTDAIPSINGATGNLNIQGGGIVNVNTTSPNITISATDAIPTINGLSGALTIEGVGANTVSTVGGNTIRISGVQSTLNGLSGAVTLVGAGNSIVSTDTNTKTITMSSTAGTGGSQIVLLTSPVRIAASNNSGGSLALLVSSGDTNNPGATAQTVQISGTSVPANAKAIYCSLTSVGATTAGNLRLWAANATTPTVNTLNIPLNSATNRGFNLTTAALAGLSPTGQVKIAYNNGSAGSTCGFSIDVVAYLI